MYRVNLKVLTLREFIDMEPDGGEREMMEQGTGNRPDWNGQMEQQGNGGGNKVEWTMGGGGVEHEEEQVQYVDHRHGLKPKTGNNVIVDESPLQNQMEKNKECEWG